MTNLWQALDKAELVWGDRWPSALFGLLKLMCFTLIGFNGQSLHENNESQGDCFYFIAPLIETWPLLLPGSGGLDTACPF